jgi:hypothetical protein
MRYCDDKSCAFVRLTSFLYCPTVDSHHLLDHVKAEARAAACAVSFLEEFRFLSHWDANAIVFIDKPQVILAYFFVMDSYPSGFLAILKRVVYQILEQLSKL